MVVLLDTLVDTDPSAFFRRYYADLYRFVSSRTGAPGEDVEDIVQETLLRAWRDRAQFRGDSEPLTWIKSIATARVMDYHRKEGRRPDPQAVGRAVSRIEEEEIPDEILESAEYGAKVRRALRALPENFSGLLVKRFYEGKSVRTIAEEGGESEDAVESRLRRALEAFRDTMRFGGGSDE